MFLKVSHKLFKKNSCKDLLNFYKIFVSLFRVPSICNLKTDTWRLCVITFKFNRIFSRPCAMVVPDIAMICEIMLVSEGFTDAKILARKFITLYNLCKELCSKQVRKSLVLIQY